MWCTERFVRALHALTQAIKLASVQFKDHEFISPYFAASAKTTRCAAPPILLNLAGTDLGAVA